jgi:beta-glucosidase
MSSTPGFRDLNHNGTLEPYEDSTLATDRRVEDLLASMTLDEKAGLLFVASITPDPLGPSAEDRDRVAGQLINHFGLLAIRDMREIAAWQNRMQELAAETRLGIPLTLASDPRHAFSTNPFASWGAAGMSQWPEPIGLAAIGDEELAERFGDVARREYLAAGLRVAIHPMADLATEPRWTRISGTFGEDADLASRILSAYVRGFQGSRLGPESVSTIVKHFPGAGPQKDGEDAHFEYGKEQVYPGGNFDYHLRPFEAALAAGASQVMPYYGVPIGTEYEEIGFGFNRGVITGLLRERFGFDGIVLTDWCLLTEIGSGANTSPPRAWGAEHLSIEERILAIFDAGCDQIGGEACPDLVVALVRSGRLAESRIDVSARRILREKFVLGLFDDPYVNLDAPTAIGSAAFVEEGLAAQCAAHTLLKNVTPVGVHQPFLPLAAGSSAYLIGIDNDIAADYVRVAESIDQAECAIVRVEAPYEKRPGAIEQYFHAGSLEFDRETLDWLLPILERLPTVVVVHLDRPAVLTPVATRACAVLGEFGASDTAVLEVVTGRRHPQGKLPFNLPSSMNEVLTQRSDVPFDMPNPLYRFGHGLAYGASTST